ncbi:MAG: hypothetical protein AMXMBFR80_17260 [Dehalococcoidia bacterium]|jgi:hypothetical protein
MIPGFSGVWPQPGLGAMLRQQMEARTLDEVSCKFIEATLRLVATDEPELADAANQWLERPPTADDLPELVKWSARSNSDAGIECSESLGALQDFLQTPGWAAGKRLYNFFDDFFSYEKFREAGLALLAWMYSLPSPGDILNQPPFLRGQSDSEISSGVRISLIRRNARVTEDPDYLWFWTNYLRLAADDPREVAPIPHFDELRVLAWHWGDQAHFAYQLGRLEGGLVVMKRHAELGPGWAELLETVKSGFSASERRDKAAYELNLAQAGVLERLANRWNEIETLVIELCARQESAAEELRTWDSVQRAVDAVAWEWRRTHSIREGAELEREMCALVGDAAWGKLHERSREDLTVYRSLRQENGRLAGLLLAVTVERELTEALRRGGVEVGPTIERKLDQASEAADIRLKKVSQELRETRVVALRNPLAHGDGILERELGSFEKRLFSAGEGQNGILGRLVMTGRDP